MDDLLTAIDDALFEGFVGEIEKLAEFGYQLLDQRDIGPYKMTLLDIQGMKEVAITTGDEEFTSYASQVKRPTTVAPGDIHSASSGMVSTLRGWIESYGMIYVGSFNQRRTGIYASILNREGFKVSPINHSPPQHGLPESWNFSVDL